MADRSTEERGGRSRGLAVDPAIEADPELRDSVATGAADDRHARSGEPRPEDQAAPRAGPAHPFEPPRAEDRGRPSTAGQTGPAFGDRPFGLRLARLHLRTGSFALARAELETAAGAGRLDVDGLLDLAEVRWRSGDLLGAGEAADALLSTEPPEDHPLAAVIAAEAAAAAGQPEEWTHWASIAIEAGAAPLDPLFAGMPVRGNWPPEVFGSPTPVASVGVAAEPAASGGLSGEAGGGGAAERAGLWDEQPGVAPSSATEPQVQLSAGRASLAAGDAERAALQLGLALRLDEALAPAVLDALGEVTSPALALVRGDALRAIGHEWEARRAYAAAASLPGDPAAGQAEHGGGREEPEQAARPGHDVDTEERQ